MIRDKGSSDLRTYAIPVPVAVRIPIPVSVSVPMPVSVAAVTAAAAVVGNVVVQVVVNGYALKTKESFASVHYIH